MRQVVLFLFLLALSGCGTVTGSYVQADVATYEAVAQEYLLYVDADARLDEKKKERRHETVRSWKARIDREGEPSAPPEAPDGR